MVKILIVTQGMEHGGTNRSLLNFLRKIDSEKYQIEILPIYHRGIYLEKLKDYTILSESDYIPGVLPQMNAKENTAIGTWINKTIYMYTKLCVHFWKPFAQHAAKKLRRRNYDIVIAFKEGYVTEFASHIRAKRHIAWVRCDYSRYLELSQRSEEDLYLKYDSIVAVSDYTTQVMKKCIPSVSGRLKAIHNLIDDNAIIEHSCDVCEELEFGTAPITLLSVGRLDPVKRFEYIPSMAAKLKDQGLRFQWYIIGGGPAREIEALEKNIDEYDVSEEVQLLGERSNPYPYYAKCTMVVCLSSSEACPNVVNEAKILHKPVITADFPSAKEYIQSGFNGIICPLEEIPASILKLCGDKTLRSSIEHNISNYRYNNAEIMEQLENLLHG